MVAGRGKPIQTKLLDGRTQHSTAPEHVIVLWDLATGKAVWEIPAPGSQAAEIRFTPDGARVAEANYWDDVPHTIQFWDVATGKPVGRVNLPQHGYHFAFDAGGKRMAVSLPDTTAIVYDLDAALQPPEPKK